MESRLTPHILDHIRQHSKPPGWYAYKPAFHLVSLCLFLYLAVIAGGAWKAIGIVGAAAQFIGLYTLLHGASHYHLAKRRKVNDALGMFLAMVLGTSFHAYRVVHLRHHTSLRQPDDPQDVIHTCPKNRTVTAILLVLASLIGAALFIYIRVPFFGAKYGSARRVALDLGLAAAFYSVVIWLLIGVLPAHTVFVLAATVITAIIWGSLIDITYHQGLPTSGDTECSRSLDCDRFGFWVLNGENRHAEHHAYPNVPLPNWRHLIPIVKPAMQKDGAVYERGYVSALVKCLLRCPVFLPPTERQAEQER